MRPLWGTPVKKKKNMNLLAMAVGLKQKESVDKIVRKFIVNNFFVMLFHYDGNVDDWKDLRWSSRALHIVAAHQTKWWFAKRFLHPDIVSQYSYIFLWDEDLGVENFSVQRYLYVIKKEGLEISQPALDPDKSEVHHKLTARQKGALVHRRINNVLPGGRKCDENSTEPPCTGWVEMMAPVFSRAAWRCAWYIIQTDTEASSQEVGEVSSSDSLQGETSTSNKTDARKAVRKQSLTDLEKFKNRWKKAVNDDDCWTDPFQRPMKKNC
uniref:Uncharacterized protein n=1 Tax=Chenopodium quinoa TaxID=63459 RepID=A0A803MFR0_CHEQI